MSLMPLIDIPKGMETKVFLLSDNALNFLPELLKKYFPEKSAWLIADDNTWKVAGEKVASLLADQGVVVVGKQIFPGFPRLHPDYQYAEFLAKNLPSNAVPIAIGSGVINDIVKCASGIANVPYCCVPTACSVDGYTSFGAAMRKDGFKLTIKCPAPYAICADTSILNTAPAPMLASGYADLLTKIPAGTDWVIADELGEGPIVPEAWNMVQNNIYRWTRIPVNILEVFNGLASTGYAMQIMRDSRPASGAEHLFAHVWEMEGLNFNGDEVSHGFKVGIGLLASTLLHSIIVNNSYEDLRSKMSRGKNLAERTAEIDDLLSKGCYGATVKSTALQKFTPVGETLDKKREFIRSHWEKMRDRVRERYVPYDQLLSMLKAAGCPTKISEIGLSNDQFSHAFRTAQLIRLRYTVLDLLYELGLMDCAINTLQTMLK